MGSNGKSLVKMAVMVLVAVLVYVFLLSLQAKKLSRVSADYNSSRKKIKRVRAALSSNPDIDRQIEVLKKELFKLDTKGARHENVASVIEAFEAEAYRLGISKRLMIEEVDSGGEGASANKLSFRIQLRCSYSILVRYISSLNQLPLLATVEGLTVKKDNIAGSNLNAELRVGTYTLP